jgi:hypothetical protein
MKRSCPLYLEQLEERCTPTTYNNPWPDPRHLTLSFAPDGTAIGTNQNQLFGLLNPQFTGGSSAWQLEILRAFQTWAVNANINIGLVTDAGQALGSPGVIQGDSRFGDVRVVAYPQGSLSDGELALEQPFDATAGTFAGDLLLNGTYSFNAQQSGSYDLYSVALHEAGHVFGLDHSPNPASPMYAVYGGVRTGLIAEDVARLQALYGARPPDAFEGSSGNGTFATASPLGMVDGVHVFPSEADVTTLGDQDFYKVNVPALDGPVTVKLLTSGLSLLQARLTVYDANHNVLGSVAALDPVHGDVTVHLNGTLLPASYYIKVESATNTVFGIGSYRLDVRPDSLLSLGNLVASVVNTVDLAGSTLGTALGLPQTVPQTNSRFDYEYYASIKDSSDVDYYSLTAPTPPTGTQNVMTVMVWGLQFGGLDPRATVFDSLGNPVAANVLTHESGMYLLQVPNAGGGNLVYYVRVAAYTPNGAQNTGDYFVGVDFSTVATTLDTLLTNNASAPGAQSFTTTTSAQPSLGLTANHDALFHFVLSTSNSTAPANAAVQLDVLDAGGNLVLSRVAGVGQTQSVTVFLVKGAYRFRLTGLNTGGAGVAPLWFVLSGIDLSDPVTPYQYNPDGSSSGPSGSSSSTSSGSTTRSGGAYSTSTW